MLQPGAELGRYRIDAPIGAGGMGEVYRARDTTLRRDVAIKVLTPDRLEAGEIHEFSARMLNEARSAAALAHPNVVAVYDVGETSGAPYIVLELVNGSPLRRYLQDSTVSLLTKVRWLRDLAAGLAAAHNAGFVHRDVKPANVMITPGGQVKLLDFGIAKRSVTAGHTDGHATLEGPASFQTQDGLLGTPRYMAPEHAAGMPVDARADQYAWGCVAYELLSMLQPVQMAVGRMPLASVVPELPAPVAAIVERALSPDRARRYPTMDMIVAEFEPFVEGRVSQHQGSYASTPPGHRAPTVQDAVTQGSLGPTVNSPLQQPQPYMIGQTAPPPYAAARPLAELGPSPVAAKRSHVGIFVFGVGVVLVVLVTAGLFLVFRALDARAGSLKAVASASASGPSDAAAPPASVASAAASAARGSGKPPGISAGAAPTKAGAATSAATSAPASRCQCQPLRGGGALCKSVNPANAVCHCKDTGGAELCQTKTRSVVKNQPCLNDPKGPPICSTITNAACPQRYRGALKNGGQCLGFNSNDESLNGALTDCIMCSEEDRAFSGVSQGSCQGLDPSTGATVAGRLLCF